MDLQDFLYRLLNSGQAPHPGIGGGMPGTVGQAAAPRMPVQAFQAPASQLRPFRPGERRPNADGSYSTEISTTWQLPNGQWVNVPSLWMGPNGPQQFDANDEDGILGAMGAYEKANGQTFARFPTLDAAEQAAKARSAAGGAGAGSPLRQTSSGGGIGDFLSNVFAPKQSGKNETIQWLTQQGYDPGTAKVIASDKTALRSVIVNHGKGQKPIEIAGKLVDPTTYKVLADFSQPQGRHTTTIGGKLVDTDTGKVIGDYGSDGKTPTSYQEYLLAKQDPTNPFKGSYTDWQTKSVREQDPTFSREKDLRQEYENNPNVKSYQIVRDNYERIRQGAQQTTGAGDLAIIFGYMKMLDPTSVVREGEQASASNAAGVPAAIRNTYNSIMSGEKLSPEARTQLLSAAEQVYSQSAQNLGDLNTRYSAIASNWQLDPSRIVQMPEKYDPLQPPPSPAGTPQAAQPQGAPALPRIGETRDGYVYKGGDPSQQSSWVPFPKSAQPPQKSDRAAPDVMRQRFGY